MAESITEFFKGQNVFITGGTGFLGSALTEKLLRSCPDVGNIYLLMREKKGADITERVDKLVKSVLFDKVRKENPQSLKKITPIYGDIIKLNLGMSETDYQILEENISIVFHCAAVIKFNESLKDTILMNTRGTREVMLLSRRMNLKVFVHVSTCYCQCDKKVVEEKLYPAPVDWKKFIEITETIDERILEILTYKITDTLPNTYTFSKALAEHVVKDLGENMPVVIVRPSIVSPSMNEPIPGLAPSLNGPLGLFLGGGKGILRTMLAPVKEKHVFDAVPVDYTIKAICIAAWDTALSGKLEEPAVYNISTPENMVCSLKEFIETGYDISYKMPLEGILWVPRICLTDSMLVFRLNMLVTQVLPALVLDYILTLRGRKPMLAKIQRKIYVGITTVVHFCVNSWIFKNDKIKLVGSKVSANNKDFSIDVQNFDLEKYITEGMITSCRYILNNPIGSARAKKTLARMLLFEKILMASASFLGLWMLLNSEFVQNILLYTTDLIHTISVEL